MPSHLQNDQIFPHLEVPAVGGGVLNLPQDLAGSFGVILIYRGHWCPFCNQQIAAFTAASEALTAEGIKVVAFSVDDETTTQAFIEKHGIPFKMGHSANIETVVNATGAYQSAMPNGTRYIETTGFILSPTGTIINATYSSRAIGRLVPSDVIGLVSFLKSRMK